MIVTPIKTGKITIDNTSLFSVLDQHLPSLKEKSVVVVTSKIVSICEGRVQKKVGNEKKDALVIAEAELYLPRRQNQYGFMITINQGTMIASAGIDESNGNGYFVLWPKNPQKSANDIRRYLIKKHQLKHLGVIISDSRITPLRRGVTGVSIAHSGFRLLNDYVGKPDIFGRIMKVEKANIADSLATAAVVAMGEGDEQQPLAVIEDLDFVHFQDHNPTAKELKNNRTTIETDVFSKMLKAVKWQKGKKGVKK